MEIGKYEGCSKTSSRSFEEGRCEVCGDDWHHLCSGCARFLYCSPNCTLQHWEQEHKRRCTGLFLVKSASTSSTLPLHKLYLHQTVPAPAKLNLKTAPAPANGNQPRIPPAQIPFPYEEFTGLFNWNGHGSPPCGLRNSGNTCYLNAVLQCLSFTRPLVAYVLQKRHTQEFCYRGDQSRAKFSKLKLNDGESEKEWCFLCAFETHLKRSVWHNKIPFSPMGIICGLTNMGKNLVCGNQEDAHEYMNYAIDRMQSDCIRDLGEEVTDVGLRETTVIDHIFRGETDSRVICTQCGNLSHRFESMTELTVEIIGDQVSCLEECLNNYTKEEVLDGGNQYYCDRCNVNVKALRRMTVNRPPNVLTILLKRYDVAGAGEYGRLSKKIKFPESLDLTPCMNDAGADHDNIYKLYAVVVHKNFIDDDIASCGHYICYIKDFNGDWYLADDDTISRVELQEVLHQTAYFLLYSREHVRPYMTKPSNLNQIIKPELEGSVLTSKNYALPSSTQEVRVDSAGFATHNIMNSTMPNLKATGGNDLYNYYISLLSNEESDSVSLTSSPFEEKTIEAIEDKSADSPVSTKSEDSVTKC